MEGEKETKQNGKNTLENQPNSQPTTLSKNAKKKLLKQQKWEAKKAEKKAQTKEQKKKEGERKRKEWEEKLSSCASEEERLKLIESRRELRKERMGKRAEEKEEKTQRLRKAKEFGLNIVIDLEFADLMTDSEIHSLVQQGLVLIVVGLRIQLSYNVKNFTVMHRNGVGEFIIYCYAVNRRCASPALQDQKENLVYLTADSETVLDELDLKKIYIVGGLVDRNRWKGLTMKKANEQGIQTAKLPISSYLKMSSSQCPAMVPEEFRTVFNPQGQWVRLDLNGHGVAALSKNVLTVNQNQRKRGETDPEEPEGVDREELEDEDEPSEKKRQCDEVPSAQLN
ncbi:hypothetical protein DKX38_023355 [Salix brachista]|uniref:tRNA (guanine(9)-N(1))-methyltransferase n=1 Tax=Salix brachista TaxID=2182728 RepID=A0A5N5JKL6_9ROSI|nr:hypothetical protein DKX38_023355 [Salix brachista]